MAQIIIDKFVDHLPIYRQIERYKRDGVKLSSSTINGWQDAVCNLLEPLYQTLKHRVLSQGYLQVDETPIQVLEKIGVRKKGKISRWDKLMAYLKDGALEIDNNPAENAIRPIALGRKNCLFAGSTRGAHRAAMIYSFMATCKKHDVNPFEWLKKVLEIIPDHKANRLHELLPQNLEL